MRKMLPLFLVLLPAGAPGFELPQGKEFTNSVGMKFVRIEPGEFVMGCGERPPSNEEEWRTRDWDESPAHKVKITRPLFMSTWEVTNFAYEQFDPTHDKLRGRFGVSQADDEPVTFVTWQQAADFCEWLSKKERRPYRLPTEAEWEYACRAGTSSAYHTGDTLNHVQANVGLADDGKRKIKTVPVGSYPSNGWGLYDMHGNVAEWCLDWYGPYVADEQVDPMGRADGFAKVTRGGSYSIPSWQENNARYCRSSNRSGHLPDDVNRCTGFRIVLAQLPKTTPLPMAPVPLSQRDVKQAPAPGDASHSKIPYYTDFRGKRPTIPQNTWGPIFSAWNHFTAVSACPNGDVLAVWYTTKSESGRELALAASRLPADSDRWQPASLFFDVPDVNDHAPVLLCNGKRIYHFCSQALTGWHDTSLILRVSDDSGATWSNPRIILRREHPDHMSQSCSAFVGKDGSLYLAADGDGHRREALLVSRDGGDSWKVTGADLRESLGNRYAIHPAVVQVSDGPMVAFLRGPDPMPILTSRDGGESWDAAETPFGGISVGQKAAVMRLAGGGLLLCAADTSKPPITGQRGTCAALSFDGGQTWPHIRAVPDVGGYLSVTQAPNGLIYLFGSRMSCAAFNEAWLLSEKN